MEFTKIVIGLVTTFLLGLLVSPFLRNVKQKIPMVPPSDILKEKWSEITGEIKHDCKPDNSGEILGRLERILFFIALWSEAYALVGGWLAFKLASKWEVWKNIISVPKTLVEISTNVEELEYLKARRHWGSQRLMSFLIGTLCNFLIAFAGVLVGKHGYDLLKSLNRFLP